MGLEQTGHPLRNKRIAVIDSRLDTGYVQDLAKALKEQGASIVFAREPFPIPDIKLFLAHQAAIIHLPGNEIDRKEYLRIFQELQKKVFHLLSCCLIRPMRILTLKPSCNNKTSLSEIRLASIKQLIPCVTCLQNKGGVYDAIKMRKSCDRKTWSI